jgi:hypothetical protein
MFTAMFTRVVSETSSDAIWHNKIPVALSELKWTPEIGPDVNV